MNFLQNLITQVQQQWRRAPLGGRIGLVASLVIIVGSITAVGIWSSRAEYVPVVAGLSPTETAEIIGVLDAKGIPAKMNSVGTSVLVPSDRLSEARVSAGDLLRPYESDSSDIPGLSIVDDPRTREVRLRQAEEKALERSILRIKGIASADVHIAKADSSVFARDVTPSTASVMIGLRPGVPFHQDQAAAIVALVSSSVEGLNPEQVTVTDSYGRILWNEGSAGDAAGSNLNEMRRRVESELVGKVNTLLNRMLGPDRFSAQVTAEIDFQELVRETLTYDESKKSKKSENIETSKTTGPAGSNGATGTASNQSLGGAGGSGSVEIGNTENLQTEWLVPSTTDTMKRAAGQIQRISVGVVANLSGAADGQAAQNGAPQITVQQLEGLIKKAVGFDDARGDQITVLDAPVIPDVQDDPVDLAAVQRWDTANQIIRNGSLGLAAICALMLGLFVLKKVQPVQIPGMGGNSELRRERLLAELSSRVQENPEVISRILTAWQSGESDGNDGDASMGRAA